MIHLAAILAMIYTPAAAEEKCGPRDRLVDLLTGKYGETVHSMGLSRKDLLVEVFASQKTGGFTIMRSTADGWSCIIAVGSNFETIKTSEIPGDDM